ncbi:hypothetical protein GW17_00045093 [Ensete ventricosum]|nr:hypothetical protein GW17_00045093 [Ensete ventricosum]
MEARRWRRIAHELRITWAILGPQATNRMGEPRKNKLCEVFFSLFFFSFFFFFSLFFSFFFLPQSIADDRNQSPTTDTYRPVRGLSA